MKISGSTYFEGGLESGHFLGSTNDRRGPSFDLRTAQCAHPFDHFWLIFKLELFGPRSIKQNQKKIPLNLVHESTRIANSRRETGFNFDDAN